MASARTRRFRPWLPALLWAAAIFGVSSIPGSRLPRMHTTFDDKVEHAFVYAILGGLCFRALRRTTALSAARTAALAVAMGLGYGVLDEVHQLFVPQRSFELLDMAADASGAALGAVTVWVGQKVRGSRGGQRSAT